MSNYFNQLSLREQLINLGNAALWMLQNLKMEFVL